MARGLSSLLKEYKDSVDIANSHCLPDFQSSGVSGFYDKAEYFFEILDTFSCVRHADLLDPVCFRTKNLLSYPK